MATCSSVLTWRIPWMEGPGGLQSMGFAQSCPTLSEPMDCRPPGSSVYGIFQARVLEWDAIAFSADLG